MGCVKRGAARFNPLGRKANVSRRAGIPGVETGVSRIEMRTTVRYPILQRCFVYPANVAAYQAWQCIAYNISATGIGVTLPIRLQDRTLLAIQAWSLAGACTLQVSIVHTKLIEHLWFTGCEFLERLPDRTLQIWRSGPLDWLDDCKQ
jgi:hypothetical protein